MILIFFLVYIYLFHNRLLIFLVVFFVVLLIAEELIIWVDPNVKVAYILVIRNRFHAFMHVCKIRRKNDHFSFFWFYFDVLMKKGCFTTFLDVV